MRIVPLDWVMSSKAGELAGITVEEITTRLGLEPNVDSEPDAKCEFTWFFAADGAKCAIWSWKGLHHHGLFSTFGPTAVFETLFPGHVGREW